MAGGRIDILVAPDTREFVGKMRQQLQPAIGAATALGGALGLAFAGTAAFGQVIKIGNDFTSTLNTMRAVANASASEMAEVSAKAKQLGNDITLPGTSANDAAAAMTELAKGGFNVKQSMDAAKGSLQLAAAAQIDAAQAATIQSSALQAFGLQASDATRVADVLANTANASSAEITDVAYALQSGGAVAHQFGLTVEDTASAIGLMANSGIKGSDAGTLLKSALLALTDQGKPAQQAMHSLGLTVYDAQGKFVGLHSLFGQIHDASKRMTDQNFQAAAATLFGSDAMRLAGIAAEKGAEGYDAMHDAMSRQGSAADVANAKMQGLPGAMERIQNAAEDMALEIYDLAKGPLEQFAKGAATFITDATPHVADALHTAADGAVDFAHALAPVVKFVADLPTPVLAAAGALAALRFTNLGTTLGTQFGNARDKIRGFNEQMAVQQQLAAASGASLSRYGAAVATLETRVPTLGKMGEAYRNASESASVLARTQGTVAAASSGLRSAASGVVSLLGGPWVLALTAATFAVTSWIEENRKAEARQKAMNDLAREGAKLRVQQSEIFAQNNGAFDTKAIDAATQQVGILKRSMDQLSEKRPGFWDKALEAPWNDNAKNENWQADRWTGAKRIMDDLKISDQQLAETLADTSKFNDLNKKLQGMGQDGRYAASALQGARDELLKTQETAKNTSPGFATLSAAVKTLADSSASAADRIDAMKTALQILSGKPVAVQDALAKYNQQVRETAQATVDVWDKTQGFGQALIGQGGQVDTATSNGQRLYDSLTKIRDATITAAEAGANMDPIIQQNGKQFEQLAASTGLSVDQVRVMAEQLGYLPKDITILAKLKGADSVEQQLVVVEGLLRTNANGVDIPVTALTDDAKKKLEETGAKIEQVNGKPGIVHVSAPDVAAVIAKLDELINKNLPDKTQRINVEYQTRGEALSQQGKPSDFVGPVTVAPKPRADGGIDGPLPSQATIQSPRSSLVQWAEPETGGEAYIPLAPAKRARSTEILGTVAGHFGFGLTKMADGGIAIDRAMTFLRGEAGKPYQYGGVGNPSWDCSALISAAYALLKGLEPHVRYFTTETDFAPLGFLPGLDPTGRGLSIGVFRGGGGEYSHMSGKLNGTPIESNSSGVHIGPGATDPGDSQFPLKMHLPGSEFSPPDNGSSRKSKRRKEKSWDESDELDLQAAIVSRDKANAQAAKDAADPKKDANDKKQAQISAQQADLRVRQLEQKKQDAQGSGGDVPEAPPLQGNLTDDQIRLAELHQAVEDAKFDRDDVYADSSATQADRDKADRDYQKAINAEKAEIKKQREEAWGLGGSGSTNSPVALLGEAVKSAVTGAAGEALSAIGLGGDIGGTTGALIGIAATVAQKQASDAADQAAATPTPTSASDDEIKAQGPVTPGTYNWLPQLLKTFQLPMVLRDQGGPLPHGVAALNLSGEEEYVLSPGDLRNARTLAASRAPAPAPVHNIDGSVTIQNLHTGMSAGEFRREWRLMQTDQRDRITGLSRRG
ncbi:phage tail tape measure protein [Nocardia africana]|uniref:Phage-related minor tail protein n=1 Tax=Nocardia africana TaxID=134964 RepID=A0A378X308_9NOCA|nr:phage tail tape measure protein [Nocardia africana]MCC3311533.1 phage tail tape measure protein [Nocardia africana]SUA47205.1 Phage-related minor tail protein [Nocardia africana]